MHTALYTLVYDVNIYSCNVIIQTILHSISIILSTIAAPGITHLGTALKNNSWISHRSIGTNNREVYCSVNDFRCCRGSTVQRGNWYSSNKVKLSSTLESGYSATQTKGAVLLYYHENSIITVSGIFRCDILDRSDTLYSFFIGIYPDNEGRFMLSSQEERLMYTGQDGPRLTSTDPELSPFQHRFSPSTHRFSPSWDHFNMGSKWSHDRLKRYANGL